LRWKKGRPDTGKPIPFAFISTREPVLIRKRGKIVAKLLPENDPDDKPWLLLRGVGKLRGAFEPALDRKSCAPGHS